MEKNRIGFLLAVVTALFILGFGVNAHGDDIKIGVIMSLTGTTSTAEFGESAVQGIKLAVKEYNAAKGYKGQPVKLVIYDDEANPTRAVELMTRLITVDMVIMTMGTVSSGNVMAFEHLNQMHHIPHMAGPSAASIITERYKNEAKNYIFRCSLRQEDQVTAIADYAVKFKKLGLIHSTTGYGQTAKEQIVAGLKQRNRAFDVIEVYTLGSNDATPQMLKMKNAGVETLVINMEEAEVVVKACNKLNYKPNFVADWGSSTQSIFNLIGKDLIQGLKMSYALDLSQKQSAAADAKFRKEYGKEYTMPISALLHYDGTRLLLEALDKAGPNPEGIRDALENIDDFETVTVAPRKPFSKTHHEMLEPGKVFLGMWQGNQIVRLNY